MAGSVLMCFSKSEITPLDDTKGYDQVFNKIAEVRIGVENTSIDKLSNPFSFTFSSESNQAKGDEELAYVLKAVVLKRAKINNLWYSVNDKIAGYTITNISNDCVILKNGTEEKLLYIRNKNDSKVKISSK